MAGKKLEFDLSIATKQAQADLKATGKAAQALEDELEDSRTAGKKLADAIRQASDNVEADLKAAASAAEALEQALGEETVAAAKAAGRSVDQMVGELKRAGLTYDDIRADVDELADALKRVDDVGRQLDGLKQGANEVEASTSRAGDSVDDLGRSADSSKSALANMIGNTTQDLGAMGGVAGSAGVAIGQMGEYMADALADGEKLSSVLSSFGKIVGPILALTAATAVLAKVQGNNAEAAKVNAESTERWSKAMDDADDAARAYVESLRDSGKVMLDLNHLTEDQTRVVNDAKSSWHGLDGLLGLFRGETEDVADVMAEASLTVEQLTRAVELGARGQEMWTEAVEASNLSGDEKAKLLALLTQEQEAYKKALEDSARNEEIFATSAENSTQAMDTIAASIDLAKTNMERFGADGVENMGDVEEATEDAADEINQLQRKYESLLGILNRRDAIRNAEAALEDLQTSAEEAFTAQTAGAEDAAAKMRDYEASVDDVIEALINAQAPPDIVAKVTTELDAGRLNEARWIAQDWLNRNPVTLPMRTAAAGEAGGTGMRGFRAAGGPVAAGGLYEVTEGGKSELLHEGGRTYLMAGQNGYVEPMSGGRSSSSPGGSGPAVSVFVDARGALGLDENRLAAKLTEIINRGVRNGVVKLRAS